MNGLLMVRQSLTLPEQTVLLAELDLATTARRILQLQIDFIGITWTQALSLDRELGASDQVPWGAEEQDRGGKSVGLKLWLEGLDESWLCQGDPAHICSSLVCQGAQK